ncbi:FAD binding domain-containing protein [Acuticoccus mangrovi]|uniref:FAD binding domain-containing protein n=1 Tax=Acuticoccus mangrovi TaxID=2796142 RepID=A0A934IDY1_9HYPH|nr:FAD binding domain-containing protein [Acuticoccus mangrovi]
MKPAPFEYRRADTREEALSLLAEHGEDAEILAGGQSLMPLLAMRLARPAMVIDINRIGGLAGVTEIEDGISVGALTRHREVARDALVARDAPVLAKAVPHIAHHGIRNRGTIGGALSLGDPAAEFPACAVAAGARLVLASAAGTRRIAAADYYLAPFETARGPEDLLVAAEFPADGRGAAVVEAAPRAGDYAIVGLVALARPSGARLRDVELVYFAAGERPNPAPAAAAILAAADDARAALAEAAEAARREVETIATPSASAAVRRHLVGALLGRAVAALFEGARP